MNRMAEEAGCSKMAISRALRKHGIRARTQAEGMVYRLALGEIAFSRFKIKAGQQVSDFESNLKYFLEIKKKIERGEKLDAEEKASLDDLIEEADRSEH